MESNRTEWRGRPQTSAASQFYQGPKLSNWY